MSKSSRLPRPLYVRHGAPLITIGHAANCILARGEDANQVRGWPRAIELTQRAIEAGRQADIDAAAEQIETSPFMSFELDISAEKKPPAAAKRPGAMRPRKRA
jgi:hypothetical protein